MENHKKLDFWSVVQWAVIIILVIWGAYKMGSNKNKELTPAEVQESKELCNQWYGGDCPPSSKD